MWKRQMTRKAWTPTLSHQHEKNKLALRHYQVWYILYSNNNAFVQVSAEKLRGFDYILAESTHTLNPVCCGLASLPGASSGISIQCCYAGCKHATSALTTLYTSLNPSSTKIRKNRVRYYIFYASSTGFVKLLT